MASQFYGQRLVESFGVPSNRIKVVYYGVDHSVFKAFNDRRMNDITTFLFLGGLNPMKGVRDVIEAFALFDQSSDALLVIGGKGKALTDLENLARKRHVAKRTLFPGYVPERDLPGLYNSADALVWPSYLGFGLPTLEAMSCGTPVIGADCFDCKEYIHGGALLYPRRDVKQLSDRFASLVESKNIWKDWSMRALKWSENFSWTKMMNEIFSTYKKLANI